MPSVSQDIAGACDEYLRSLAASGGRDLTHREAEAAVILKSGLFDLDFYCGCRGIQFTDLASAVNDYVEFGAAAGGAPNIYFNGPWYFSQNPEIAAAGINPFAHYLLAGAAAGLDPSPEFAGSWYATAHPDLAETGGNPLAHYLLNYRSGGCDPHPLFDVAWYLEQYPDIAATGEDPFRHYLVHGAWEGRFPNPLFDSQWYLAEYPDIAGARVNPLIHYYRHGEAEGRRPNPVFDARWYAARHAVAGADRSALAHALRCLRDGTLGRFPDFDPAWYREAYPDVAESGLHPLIHYVRTGWRESRKPKSPLERETVTLAADYSLSAEDFSIYRQSWLSMPPGKGRGVGRALLRVVVDAAAGDGPKGLRATLAALSGMTVPAGCHVDAILYDPAASVRANGVRVVADRAALAAALSPEAGFEGAGDLILFLAAGDLPEPELLSQVLPRLGARTRLALFDSYFADGDRVTPVLLPGVNPVHALNVDYFRSRFLAVGDAVRDALAAGQPGAGPRALDAYGIALHVLGGIAADREGGEAIHVALPLLRIVETAGRIAEERRRMTLAAPAGRFTFPAGTPAGRDAVRRPTVSMVICTKDNEHLIEQLVRSILTLGPADRIAEIVLVPSEPDNPYSGPVFKAKFGDPRIKVTYFKGPFNFSAKCNQGAAAATGDILLFLNDDIVPVSANWLDELLAPFANPDIAAAGPLLVYPNAKVQHCGVYAGGKGTVGHDLRFARLPEQDYLFLGSAPRNVSVVTGAALAIRRDLFEALNGFDVQLANYIQDVDLCLRVLHGGHAIVLNPRSVLIHMETTTLKEDLHDSPVMQARGREFDHFMRRWGRRLEAGDPYRNPRLLLSDESLRTLAVRDVFGL